VSDQKQYELERGVVHGYIHQDVLPVVEDVKGLSPGDVCHYAAPVRFGRRRADQFGHLLLTSTCLRFRGAMDVSIAWTEVTSVHRMNHEIVVSLHESRRELRFWCDSLHEADDGVVIGTHLRLAAAASTST
jgi:hypothetical protein